MGGCRCSFQYCNASTSRNPGMHFFHFPKRNIEQWARFTGVENFLELPERKRKNKVICGRHFLETCFTNYKMDRLLPTAIPTITRLNDKYALNYEKDPDNPELIEIKKPTAPHLIPPPDFPSTLCLNAAEVSLFTSIVNDYKKRYAQSDAKQPRLLEINDISGDICSEIEEILFPTTETECSKKVENNYEEYVEIINNEEQMLRDQIKVLENLLSKSNEKVESLTKSYNKKIETLTTSKEKLFSELTIKEEKIHKLEAKIVDLETEYNLSEQQQNKNDNRKILALKNNLDAANELNLSLNSNLNEKTKNLDELQDKIKNIEIDYNLLQKYHEELQVKYNILDTTSTESKLTPRLSSSNQQLTKLQVFNGIKKYLSQTMIALLRIQICSGSIEREWKPDERRLALDLLGLGENVYKFFTDEWLIRLPPLNQVEKWNEEAVFFEEDDDL